MRQLAWLLLGLTLLTSCAHARQSMSCDEIANLRAQIGKTFTREALRTWILSNYSSDANKRMLEDEVGDGESVIFQWGDLDGTYYLVVLKGNTLAEFEWSGIEATAGEVIACLGEPDRYAYYPVSGVSISFASLDLLFPTAGVYASGARTLPVRPDRYPQVDAAFPIDELSFTQPVSSGETFLQTWVATIPGGQPQLWLNRFRPWPANWEDIIISD